MYTTHMYVHTQTHTYIYRETEIHMKTDRHRDRDGVTQGDTCREKQNAL